MSSQHDTTYIIRSNEPEIHVGYIGAGGYGEIHSVLYTPEPRESLTL